jgi:AcrR family transcriptional regulator
MPSTTRPSPGVAGATTDRPLRADARRNRTRVLEAATACFADGGDAVPIDEVARRAGVGVGTVCRHFPTKQALVDAVVEDMVISLVARARVALEAPDPGTAFEVFVHELADAQARHRALAEQMAANPELPAAAQAAKAELRAALRELVDRAQRVGAVRDDVSPADISLLFVGMAGVTSIAGEAKPELRARYVTLLLDGLRPAAASPLPGHALTYDELDGLRRRLGHDHDVEK